MQPLTTAEERMAFARARRNGYDIRQAEQAHIESLQQVADASLQGIREQFEVRHQEISQLSTQVSDLVSHVQPYDSAEAHLAQIKRNLEELNKKRTLITDGIAETQSKLDAQKKSKTSLMNRLSELHEARNRKEENYTADKITREGEAFCTQYAKNNGRTKS